MDAVSLPSGSVIDQFLNAVHVKYNSDCLKNVSVGNLLVYKNKSAFDQRNTEEPLEEDALVDGLGLSKMEALAVTVHANEPIIETLMSIRDKVKNLGVQFRIRDIRFLFDEDVTRFMLLQSPHLTLEEAQAFLTFAKSKIKLKTQRAIRRKHNYLLKGLVNTGQEKIKSSLYYAFTESARVLAAKVYYGHKDDFEREVEINQALNHKNLVKFIKTFSIEDDVRHVIIMPFLPRSVENWLDQWSILPLPAVKNIARDCFDALCYLHSQKLCFGDLKPANIMLGNSGPITATLVDFGATVRIGTPIIECTPHYCLESGPGLAIERLDWICLGTTLAQMGGFNVLDYNWTIDLIDDVRSSSTIDTDFKNLILSCLESPSSSKIETALHQFLGINA